MASSPIRLACPWDASIGSSMPSQARLYSIRRASVRVALEV